MEVVKLFDGAGGEALATLLTGISEDSRLTIAPAELPAFLTTLMSDVSVTRPAGADPRIHIWGTLEARLQSADLLILGGLDEKVWPAETRTDPWLSRAMRTEIGLPPPERRIGLAAHDFAEAFAAPRVILTRAEKRGGAPTVASRWLQRLFALAGEAAVAPLRMRRRPLCGACPRHRPSAGPTDAGCRAPRRRRRWNIAHGTCRSPRLSAWSATPTRSTPSICSASSRSIRSAWRPITR